MKDKLRLFITIVIFAGIFVLLLRWLPSIGSIVTTSPSTPMDSSEFYEDGAELTDDGYETITIDKETVTAMLESYETPSRLSMDITYTLSSGSTDSVTYMSYTKNGTRETIRSYSSDRKLQKTYSLTASSVSISDASTGEIYTFPKGTIYRSDKLLHLPELDWFYSASVSNVREMRFDRLDDNRVLYIEYYYPSMKQTERYWVSTEYGVILRAETALDGDTYISVAVTSIE